MPTQPAAVSVTIPVNQAIERVKLVLFRPFDLGKWFTIGFCAWLAYLGQNGVSANFNGGSSHGGGVDIHEKLQHVWGYVLANLYWILPFFVALMFIGFALGVLLLWLRSHGQFMFLHCVALNRAEITAPWEKFSRQGNSLFLFRLVLGLISMIPTLPLLTLIIVLVIRMVSRGGFDVSSLLVVVAFGLMLFAVGVVHGVIAKLTTDFVVPIMFLRGGTCVGGWKELLGLFSDHAGRFVLYLLFQIVLGLATGIVIVMAFLATCCIACCLMILPYLGTVLLLPILVFKRSYSLYYLAQYGREYDVFPATPPPFPGTVPL